jgi:hypothetical protein
MSKRERTNEGRFKEKRGDTLIGNIEKQYNVDFGARSDKQLSTYLKEEGLPSLAKALDKAAKKAKR